MAFAAGLPPGRVPPGAQTDPGSGKPLSRSLGEGQSTLPCRGRQGCAAAPPPRAGTPAGAGAGTQTPYHRDPAAECAGTFCPGGALSPCVK